MRKSLNISIAISAIITIILVGYVFYNSVLSTPVEETQFIYDGNTVWDNPIEDDPVEATEYEQVELTIKNMIEYPNGTIKRCIHGIEKETHSIVEVWNITVTVHFPYENATYRGYTEEIYFVCEYLAPGLEHPNYCLWDVTEIYGEYMDAEAYGWKERC